MRILIFCTLWALPGLQYADALSRFIPASPAPVPALWWAIDASAPLPIASLKNWFTESALGQPAASLRPLPAAGVGIGLLAAVPDAQGIVAVRELMPPWPLNSTRAWPEQSHYRAVGITQADVSAAGISIVLPLPSADQSVTLLQANAELLLPRAGPAQGPYVIAASSANQPMQQVAAYDRGAFIAMDLIPLLEPWLLAGSEHVMLNLSASLDTPWSLAAISDAAPARWQLSWQSPSALLTGRAQWQRILDSLLLHTGARTPSQIDLIEPLRTQVQGQGLPKETPVNYRPPVLPPACGGLAGLLISADSLGANISERLTHWLDAVLQGPTQPYRLIPRRHAGRLLGTDVYYATPRLGRALWRADHDFRACNTLSTCGDISGHQPSLQKQAATQPLRGVVFSDTLMDAQGQLTVLPRELASETQVTLGDSLVIDIGADPTRTSGRAHYLLWLGVDGTLYLRDGDSGDLLWRWQPSAWQMQRTRLLAEPAALKPESLAAQAMQLWSGKQGERLVYAVLDGRLVAVDLTQPLQPKRLMLATSDLLIDSLTLLPSVAASLANTHDSQVNLAPELLLGVRVNADLSEANTAGAGTSAALPSIHLLRMNGRTGAVSWRAHAAADDTFEPPVWPLPWTFIRWQQSLRGYGVDSRGRTWRLQVNSSTGEFIKPVIVAELGESGDAVEVFASPALSIQSDANGRRRVAISLATRTEPASGIVLSAWLDDEGASPLRLSSLPSWSSATAPPTHSIGWQRRFSSAQELGLSPKWLDARLLLTLERAFVPAALCTAAEVQTRLYDMPWRVGVNNLAGKEVDLGTAPTQLSEPVLTEQGTLHWLGQTKPDAGLGVSAYRQRLSKTPVSD